MKKIYIIIFIFIASLSFNNFAKADVIPQGEKAVTVCQKIINIDKYQGYKFYIDNDGQILTKDSCLNYYKFFGGLLKANSGMYTADYKIYGNSRTAKDSDTLVKIEQYFEIKEIKGSIIKIDLVGENKIFEDGSMKQSSKNDINDLKSSVLKKENSNPVINDSKNIVLISLGIIFGVAVVSFLSIFVYRKLNKTK